MIYIVSNNGRHPLTETSNTLHPTTLHSTSLHLSTLHFLPFKLQTNIILGPVGTGSEPHHSHRSTADVPNARILFNDPHVKWCFMNTRKEISLYSLTFRHRASCIQDRRFTTLQRTLFIYLINKYISLSDICLTVHH